MTVLNTNQDFEPNRLRQAFGFFPTGVVAVAADLGSGPVGLAASSFTSVSVEPPLVSINLAVTSQTWPALRQASHLGVTVLADHQAGVCRKLAGPVDGRFEDVPYVVTENGAVTLDEGLVRFDCTIYREVDAGDHILALLELHRVDHVDHDAASSPLVFHRSGFGLQHGASAGGRIAPPATKTHV